MACGRCDFPGFDLMITQAFILGAGLGTRLRPLTDHLPKPLVPLFHKPLATWAIEACEEAGCSRFAINTHHLPESWAGFKGERDVSFFHEEILLETGGGLKNIEPWLQGEHLLIHNGDIFSSMDLQALVDQHLEGEDEVTLALRSEGGSKKITLGANSRIEDVRSEVKGLAGTHVFSGIYCIRKKFLSRIAKDCVVSVIPAFQDLVREGKIGGSLLDEGKWIDLGDEASYLTAHRELDLEKRVHQHAKVHPDADVGRSVIGRGAEVGAGARLANCVVWPGVKIPGDARLSDAVVCT